MPLPHLFLLLLAQLGGAPAVTPRDGAVTLPPGAVATLLEAVDLAGPRAELHLEWPEWQDRSAAGWGGERPWRRWVELLRAEAAASAPDPARRAELAALARLQGRDADAWRHLLSCRAAPEIVAALFPLFLPGVPPAVLAAGEPWPEDVVLRPALPPSDDPRGGLRALRGTVLAHAGFAVGAARLSLGVRVDGDGAGLTLKHLGGDAVRVRARPPLPRGVDAGLLFVDWERAEDNQLVPTLRLDAEQSEQSLWLTFHRPRTRWPAPLGPLPAVAGRELVLVTPSADEPPLRRTAEALGELLGLQARLARTRPGAPAAAAGPGLEPLVLALDEPAALERKWVSLLGQAEAYALGHR